MKNNITNKVKYLIFLSLFLTVDSGYSKLDGKKKTIIEEKCSLYSELKLSEIGLKENVFDLAISGWNKMFKNQHLQNTSFLSIVDLSQSSNSKRLYIIDIDQKKVIFNTYVAHGRNSGGEFASSFANKPESFKSSLGFYVTGETYNGAHGLSMRLKGIEKEFNGFAEKRGIVMHGAPYVCESFINQNGRLGRSKGCPAVSPELCNPIVNCIKQGSCFFMFYPDSTYYKKSVLF